MKRKNRINKLKAEAAKITHNTRQQKKKQQERKQIRNYINAHKEAVHC